MLVLNNITFVHEVMLDMFDEDDWDQFGENGDHLAFCLTLGDNFSVNVEGVDFYILMCTKTMYTLQKPYTCVWGQ